MLAWNNNGLKNDDDDDDDDDDALLMCLTYVPHRWLSVLDAVDVNKDGGEKPSRSI